MMWGFSKNSLPLEAGCVDMIYHIHFYIIVAGSMRSMRSLPSLGRTVMEEEWPDMRPARRVGWWVNGGVYVCTLSCAVSY